MNYGTSDTSAVNVLDAQGRYEPDLVPQIGTPALDLNDRPTMKNLPECDFYDDLTQSSQRGYWYGIVPPQDYPRLMTIHACASGLPLLPPPR